MIGSKVRIKETDEVYPDQFNLEGTVVDVIDWHETMLYRVYFPDKHYDDIFSTSDFEILSHSTLRDTLDEEMIREIEKENPEIDLDL